MKILNQLTHKHLLLNKKRTITTILGICLSTALMVGIGLLFATVRDTTIREVVAEKGSYEVNIHEVNSDLLYNVENIKGIKKYGYSSSYGSIELDSEEYVELIKLDNSLLKELEIINGRLPKNDSEVVMPEDLVKEYNLKIDDSYNVTLEDGTAKSLTIVGIVKDSYIESFCESGLPFYTAGSFNNELVTLFIEAKKAKDIYSITDKLLPLLNSNSYEYNSTLLSLYGVSKYENIVNGFTSVMAIMLGIVSVGCIIVIYNSFAISVMERKKQFGLFASIGATRKQLKYTVFYEALIVGTIGIILGILGAYFGIGIVIIIINNLLKDIFAFPLHLVTYPLFLIVPIIFMVITILLSALLPAKIASKVSPIQAIRQNDDIKMNAKKIKTKKVFRKMFGMEGEIALKNIKRNKKKYRITIISLFISVVMFISFSSLLKYGLESSVGYLDLPDFNIAVTYDSTMINNDENIKIMEDLKKLKQIDNAVIFETADNYEISSLDKSYFTESFINDTGSSELGLFVIGLPDSDYQALIDSYDLEEGTSLVINKYNYMSYKNNSRKKYEGKIFNKEVNEFLICKDTNDCKIKLDNVKYTENVPFGVKSFVNSSSVVVLTNSKIATSIYKKINPDYKDELTSKSLLIKADKYDKLTIALDEVIDKQNEEIGHLSYYNLTEQIKLMRNLILVIKILLYGFISLVTLIGVTSVFNTINTNINLRRKEFAVLRSIGLTPKGFNKMLYFECIFFGLKALIYSLPVSTFLSYLIYKSTSNFVEQPFVLPWNSIILAIVGVFVIIFITMIYSSKKIKHENILEAIREENI